jgi:poly-gamma-glutamate synthesis protein (capsule biosynthesis protein)
MVPMRIRRLQVRHAAPPESAWLQATMDRECRRFGGRVTAEEDGRLVLRWQAGG